MNKQPPLVSICIPTYNASPTILETLTSILNQSYRNLEIIISDNDSYDNTLELIQSVKDSRLIVYKNDTNIGAEGNFSRCISLASGKYTAIYHSDDLYEADIVQKQVAYLESHPDSGAVFTQAHIINENGTIMGTLGSPRKIIRQMDGYNFQTIFKAILRYGNFFVFPSAMVRSDIYKNEIKLFRYSMFGSSADLDIWLRILQQHSIGILPDQLMRYRISEKQGSHLLIRMRIERADFFRVIDFYLEQPEVRAMMSPLDLRNHAWLECTDRVVRAKNLMLACRFEKIPELTSNLFTKVSILTALNSIRRLQTVLLSIFFKLTVLFHMETFGSFVLHKVVSVVRK